MKKASYTLIALLVICVAAIGYLAYERVGDRRQMKLLGEQVDSLHQDLDALRLEKLSWESEKAHVAKNLAEVRQVLTNTLSELGEVVDSIDLGPDTAAAAAPGSEAEENTQEADETAAPEEQTQGPASTSEETKEASEETAVPELPASGGEAEAP